MKITKQQLKQIIKEELDNMVDEGEIGRKARAWERGDTREKIKADEEERIKKAAASRPPHVNRDPAQKAADEKRVDDSTLINNWAVVSSLKGYIPYLTLARQKRVIDLGLDTKYPDLWNNAKKEKEETP